MVEIEANKLGELYGFEIVKYKGHHSDFGLGYPYFDSERMVFDFTIQFIK